MHPTHCLWPPGGFGYIVKAYLRTLTASKYILMQKFTKINLTVWISKGNEYKYFVLHILDSLVT